MMLDFSGTCYHKVSSWNLYVWMLFLLSFSTFDFEAEFKYLPYGLFEFFAGWYCTNEVSTTPRSISCSCCWEHCICSGCWDTELPSFIAGLWILKQERIKFCHAKCLFPRNIHLEYSETVNLHFVNPSRLIWFYLFKMMEK